MKQLNLNVLHNLELNLFKDVVLKKNSSTLLIFNLIL